MACLVRPAKVMTWMNDMTLEMFVRQLDIWKTTNTDVLKSNQLQDLVKSLKLNKDIKGLVKYLSMLYKQHSAISLSGMYELILIGQT